MVVLALWDCGTFDDADYVPPFFDRHKSQPPSEEIVFDELDFYDHPAFVEEMMDANADLIIQIMDQVLDHTDVDAVAMTAVRLNGGAP